MEWQQIEYFIAVAQLQHMTNAAKELSLTQSALSRSISALEKELGVELFERSGRNLVLNRYGRLFLERATLALMEIEKGRQEIADLINPSSGLISLSFLHAGCPANSVLAWFVPGTIRRHPIRTESELQ